MLDIHLIYVYKLDGCLTRYINISNGGHMKGLSVYKNVVHEKQYLKLIAANVVNRFGDSIDAIAFSWMAYQITGSATWMAIVFAFNAIPSIILMPFAGAWVEAWDKKLVMVLTDIGRALIVLFYIFLYISNAMNPYVLIVGTLLISTLEAFRIPAGMAIIPLTLSKENYESGMSLNATLRQFSMVVGLALAGGVITLFGVVGAMVIDLVTFLLSGLFIYSIQIEKHVKKLEKSSTFYLIKEGFIYLKKAEVIFTLSILGVFMNFLFSPFGVLQTPYVVDILKQQAFALSIMGVANVSGMGLGSFVFPMISKSISRHKILTLSGVGIGVSFILFTFLHQDIPLYLLLASLAIVSFIFGLSAGLLQTSVTVSFMSHVDKEYIARAGSIFNALVMGSIPLSSLLLSGITLLLQVPQIMLLYGILSIGLFILVSFNRSLAKL